MDVAIYAVISILPAVLVGFMLYRTFNSRIASLQTWIDDARKQHSRLEKDLAAMEKKIRSLQGQFEELETLKSRQDKLHRFHKKAEAELEARIAELEKRLAETESRQQAQAEAVQVVKTVGAKEAVAEVAGGLFASPVFKDVVSMLEAGEDSADIARKTGLQVGEIGLIRGLKGFSGKRGGT